LYVKAVVDQGGIGMGLAERIADRFSTLVEGVSLSAGMQGKLAEQIGREFEARRVRIPDDEEIRNDFQLVAAPKIVDGKSKVATDRDESGHADRFWAAALGMEGALHFKRVFTARPYATPAPSETPQRQPQDAGPPMPEVRRVGRPYYG
jgi:phage FluMu gp28-like protein